jgi:hypothetical protein
MRKITFITAILIVFVHLSYSQFIGIPEDTKKDVQNNHLILGFINPKNFSFQSTFGMSYNSYGSASYSLASYTGTLAYKIRDNMNISADITMQYAPSANLGTNNLAANKSFQNYLNGINLSRLSFNWMPAKNLYVNFSYINNKSNYFNSFDNYYSPGFFGY